MSLFRCRFCNTDLKHTFVDLGLTPLANSFVNPEDAERPELFFPLHVRVCEGCFLVQLPEVEKPENIFSDYVYFSSYSQTWLDHAKAYTEKMTNRFGLNGTSQVVEVASNDGYLLQYFREKGIRVLGVEPAANVAEHAIAKGVDTRVAFFGESTAKALAAEGFQADLMASNNVLAHVPDINDFVEGFRVLLKGEGVWTVEFPHLLNLVEKNQFDTIYHEHYSYLSLTVVEKICNAHELSVFDVEKLPTHGGSLRVFIQRSDTGRREIANTVAAYKTEEEKHGLTDLGQLTRYGEKVKKTKRDLLDILIKLKNEGKSVVGYGAAAKGNTLLNYCGIGTDFLDYVVDKNPAKQNSLLPGTRIPVFGPEKVATTKPDYLLILPWNITEEIVEQNQGIRQWGGRFIRPIPAVEVF